MRGPPKTQISLKCFLQCPLFFTGTGVTANSVYPGISKSRLDRHIGYGKSKVSRGITVPFVSPIKKTSLQGAQTSVFAGVEPTLEKVSGKYFR